MRFTFDPSVVIGTNSINQPKIGAQRSWVEFTAVVDKMAAAHAVSRARCRTAEAFGLKVPGIAPKVGKNVAALQ